ncbi:MAG: hypothetical protein QOD81_3338, partial [Solirubrobacteraceae bacterium]|nr:hypothetical protein [Solirubrobacteraceae bacterium]
KPGEHYAGIVAVDAAQADAARKPAKARGRVSVHQLARLALPVRLTVPGPLSTRLALTKLRFGVDASGPSLRIGLRNAGNQIIRQTAIDLEVTTQDGRSLLEIRGTSATSSPARRSPTPPPGAARSSAAPIGSPASSAPGAALPCASIRPSPSHPSSPTSSNGRPAGRPLRTTGRRSGCGSP